MPSLNLDYGDDVPAALLDLVELHARHLGLPLAAVETIGQDLERTEAFLVAVEDGRALAFGLRAAGLQGPFPRDPRPAPLETLARRHLRTAP